MFAIFEESIILTHGNRKAKLTSQRLVGPIVQLTVGNEIYEPLLQAFCNRLEASDVPTKMTQQYHTTCI